MNEFDNYLASYEIGRQLGQAMKLGAERGLMGAIIDLLGTAGLLEFAIEIDWIHNCVGDDQFKEIIAEFRRHPEKEWNVALQEATKKVLSSIPA